MKQILSLVFIVLIFTNCSGIKKFNRLVEPKINDLTTNNILDFGNVKFDITKLNNQVNPVQTTRKKGLLIPAIFITIWNYNFLTQINPTTASNDFINGFMEVSDSLNYRLTKNGQQLNITVENIPNSYVFETKGFMLFFVLGYYMQYKEIIVQDKQSLTVSYCLSTDSLILKQGKYLAKNKQIPIKNTWLSRKKFVWQQLEQYRTDLKEQSYFITDKILYDLEQFGVMP